MVVCFVMGWLSSGFQQESYRETASQLETEVQVATTIGVERAVPRAPPCTPKPSARQAEDHVCSGVWCPPTPSGGCGRLCKYPSFRDTNLSHIPHKTQTEGGAASSLPVLFLATSKDDPFDMYMTNLNHLTKGLQQDDWSIVIYGSIKEDKARCAPPQCVLLPEESTGFAYSTQRTGRIAHGRNRLMEYARKQKQPHTLVMVDLDLNLRHGPTLLDGIAAARPFFDIGVRAMTFKSAAFPYNDIWALRWSGAACNMFNGNCRVPFIEQQRKEFAEAMQDIEVVHVPSAFNGIEIFNGLPPAECIYSGWEFGFKECEHVPFHACLGGVAINFRMAFRQGEQTLFHG